MLTLLSPAKTMDFGFRADGLPTTEPRFERDIKLLLKRCRKLTVADLRKLMKLSQPLAELNRQRFHEMTLPFTPDNSKPCLLAFGGDVYRGLAAASLSKRDLTWAQRRLRILSGFYGLLRPLDLIQPYRLEMGDAARQRARQEPVRLLGRPLDRGTQCRARTTSGQADPQPRVERVLQGRPLW